MTHALARDLQITQEFLPSHQTRAADFLAPSKYHEIIRNRVIAAGATGILIGPGVDIPALIAIWAEGTIQLAGAANVTLKKENAASFVVSVMHAAAQWIAAGLILDVLTMMFPGANIAVNGFVNALYTFRYLNAIAIVLDDPANAKDALGPAALDLVKQMLQRNTPAVLARDIREVWRLLYG